ncbi:hypothetical protein HAX54_047226 [Datura stramonium]|uniref:Uncharacterized protein n=1 Tax=Datura stramonium TaxID=4076 RepID=A0ABS8WI11_DATST|nr:hypothetical protein [Datura stramonium]
MEPKVNKGKGVGSYSHGSKRSRRTSEDEHEDVRMAPPPLRLYGLRSVTEKEGKKWFKEHKESKYPHDMFNDRNFLSLAFTHMLDRILTLGLGFSKSKKGQNFGFGGLLTRFLCGHDIEEEEADYRTSYDPRGIDVTKMKEPEGINGPDTRSLLMMMWNEMARVDSHIESSDDNEEDSAIGEVALAPTYDEE